MEHLRCPVCRAVLRQREAGLECGQCGVAYPLADGTADFTRGLSLDDRAARQRDIYEGRDARQGVGAYLDPDAARGLTDAYVESASRGPLTPNWLGLEYRRAMDSLEPRGGEKVLDVGCSTGFMLSAIGRAYGTRGVGIDFSAGAIARAAAYNPLGNEYYVADALNLPFEDGSFDVAVSFGVIEHVSDHARMVAEISRVLNGNGRALLYTTCRRSRWTWHWWQRLTSGGRYHLGVDDLAGHDPETFLAPEELAAMLAGAGMARTSTRVVHSLYSLVFDESFPGMVPFLLSRPAALATVAKVVELADAPMADRGYGNEFLAMGWKGA